MTTKFYGTNIHNFCNHNEFVFCAILIIISIRITSYKNNPYCEMVIIVFYLTPMIIISTIIVLYLTAKLSGNNMHNYCNHNYFQWQWSLCQPMSFFMWLFFVRNYSSCNRFIARVIMIIISTGITCYNNYYCKMIILLFYFWPMIIISAIIASNLTNFVKITYKIIAAAIDSSSVRQWSLFQLASLAIKIIFTAKW